MPRTADVCFGSANTPNYTGAGTIYQVETPAGVLYQVYVEGASDVVFRKSTDRGVSWSTTTTVYAGTVTQLAVWYDKWSTLAGGLIHMAYAESVTDDVFYRTINTESSDALSTQTTIFAGASTLAGCYLSITRAKGGNVYCQIQIDAGSEGGFYRLSNANVPNGAWDAARTNNETLTTQDQSILLPNLTSADNQDIMCIFWDASADEISRKLYDDSANSWGETSIATTMVDQAAATAFPHFAAAVDLTNSRIVLVAWSAVDTANADLRCWTITDSAITEVTNVVLNSTDDQGLCGISIDSLTGDWYVFYGGKSDGSETFSTAMNIYFKVSTDDGTTWGAETKLSQSAMDFQWLCVCPWLYTRMHGVVVRCNESVQGHVRFIGAPLLQPRATHQIYGG